MLLALSGAALASCGAQGRAAGAATPFPIAVPPEAPLRPLGGLVLDGLGDAVNGLSALHLDPDLRLTALSDLGSIVSARLVMEGERPVGLADLRSTPLRDGAGASLGRGRTGDAEALAQLPDGTWLVTFERWHRIRAYRRLDGPGRYVEAPPGLGRAPSNAGLESLAVLADGRWLAIAEGLHPPNHPTLRRAWLGRPSRWVAFAWRPAPEFHPADAAPLPDGGALVLERRFSLLGGFSSRLLRIPAAALASVQPETVLEGEEILRLDGGLLPADNWEGVAVTRWRDQVLVALVSDDNRNIFQRSMLLLFVLDGE